MSRARATSLDQYDALPARAVPAQRSDAATLARLRALGYVGGPTEPGTYHP